MLVLVFMVDIDVRVRVRIRVGVRVRPAIGQLPRHSNRVRVRGHG